MDITILGPGCRNCINLENETRKAVDSLSLDATINHVTDYAQIMSYGIMATPGLVIDGEVVISGRVPKAKEIEQLLQR
ncbi:thioredoxin family protein [Trueperella pecoris]|uniref:TM0996/MTH895 family glutaredoxin-like protein n=1 Tax=Trueperella pecoris TaxID=2733571 RepID=A0A7M1QT93_9ACTO|nr:thioredoxin family protein [Trueperella pecoris]QOR45118.1 TM0996/MTH895 family glutaredoxin-like protein [Trueperella pecoris]